MKREAWRPFPALVCAAAVAVGILVAALTRPPLGWILAAQAAVVLLCTLRKAPGSLLPLLLLVCAGAVRMMERLPPAVPYPPSGAPVTLVGRLEGWEVNGELRNPVEIAIESCVIDDTIRAHDETVLVHLAPQHASGGRVLPGSRIALSGKLERLRGPRNPGEFDRESWYAVRGIRRQVRCDPSGILILDTVPAVTPARLAAPIRDHVIASCERYVGGVEGEFLKGIILGDRSGIPRAMQEDFRIAGVAHVLAVSGGNVAVIVLLASAALELLRFPRKGRLAFLSVVLLVYMIITGSQPPVVRATLMAMAVLIGKELQRSAGGLNLLGAAGVAMLLVDPLQLFDVGFQLSFCAVFGLIILTPLFEPHILRLPGSGRPAAVLRDALRITAASVSATLGTLPVSISAFGAVSVAGLVVNSIVVPATGLALLAGCITACAALVYDPIAQAYGALCWLLLLASEAVSTWSAGVPGAQIVVNDAGWYAIAVLTTGIGGLCLALRGGAFALVSGVLIMALAGLAWGADRNGNEAQLVVFDTPAGRAEIDVPGLGRQTVFPPPAGLSSSWVVRSSKEMKNEGRTARPVSVRIRYGAQQFLLGVDSDEEQAESDTTTVHRMSWSAKGIRWNGREPCERGALIMKTNGHTASGYTWRRRTLLLPE